MCLPIIEKPKIQKMSGGKQLKRKALAFTILTLTLTLIVSLSLNMKTAKSANDYNIEHVNHKIKIMYNGYIFINDTIQITGQASDGFLMGLPYKYGSHILQCFAYNSSKAFPVILDASLNDTMGFYGVRIDSPPSIFTVGFVLSNNLLTQTSNTSRFILDFPAYPTFTKTAASVNASISIENATYVSGNPFTYWQDNLPAFTSSPANVTFALTGSQIQLFDINEVKSEFTIDETGAIKSIDNYYITNEMLAQISSIEINLPPNASNPIALDQFGRTMTASAWVNQKTGRYKVSFSTAVESYRSSRFSVKYDMPKEYMTQTGTNNFNFRFPLFKTVNYYIAQASLKFVLPEGAKISSFKTTLNNSAYSITKNVFQETITITRGSISYLDSLLPSENFLQFEYQYNPLWASFRPTLWVWALALVGCAVAVVWKRPKAPTPTAMPTVAVALGLEDLKSFVDSYEEKQKIMIESESLENMVRKGRIPRQRYKVRKKTLEIRLNTLSRSLTELKEKMRRAGGKYADLMRQLEIAEIEINESEAGMKSIEARHSRGEISLEAYRKLLTDYQRRKERAQTTINGILLRLREEIH